MSLHLPVRTALAFASVALLPLPSQADLYILPSGAGSKNGSTWENALPGKAEDFQSAWNALTPDETLHVGSGSYTNVRISANKGGQSGKPLRLKGVDRGGGLPLITSNFDKQNPDKSGIVFFEAKFGITDFEIDGFRLKGCRCAVFMRGRHSNVKISNLLVEEAREGIRSEGGGTPENPDAATHDVIVSDCRFINFTKRGIRLEAGNYGWRIERCHADAGGKEWATEPFQMGYQVANKSLKDSSFEHHITFVDCWALNSYHEPTGGKEFWNGDGFCAESKVNNLRYFRCVSMHHTDGGWDDKSDAPEFVDCVSIDNKENFRLWSKNAPARMTNVLSAFAHKRGGTGPQTGLWALGSLNARNCTFFGNSSQITIEAEKAAPDAKLVFQNCIFDDGNLLESDKFKLVDSIVSKTGGTKVDTGIRARPDVLWQDGTQAFDSTTLPNQGFSVARWGKTQP